MSIDPGLALGWLLEFILFTTGLGFLAWRVGRKWLLLLTLGTFSGRLFVGLGLYFISLFRLPVLTSLQQANGFWSLGPDALNYHLEAVNYFLPALASGPGGFLAISLDYFDFTQAHLHLFDNPFAWVLGLTYAVFGASPAQGLLLNAALATVCVPLVYLAADAMQMPRASARVTAAAVAFWPSTIVWSGQLLKDPVNWAALFAVMAGISVLLTTSPRYIRTPMLPPALLASAGMFFTASLRSYASATWVFVTVMGILLATGVGAVVSRRSSRAAEPGVAADPHDAPRNTRRVRLTRALVLVAVMAVGNTSGYSRFVAHLVGGESEARVYGTQAAKLRALAREGLDIPLSEAPPVPYPGSPCPPLDPLMAVRWGYVITGGGYLVEPDRLFDNCWDIAAYAPRAYEITFLSPSPLDPVHLGEATGRAAYLGAFDLAVLWLMLPGLLVGALHWALNVRSARIVLLLYLLILGFALGFGVDNFGTLFRVRLQVVLPATLVAGHGWVVIGRWIGTGSWQRLRSAVLPAGANQFAG